MFKLILLNIYSSSLLIFIIISGLLMPSNWTYQADLLNATNANDIEIKELIGNVVIKKDSMTLLTNKALLYSNDDKLELFGDIHMTENGNILECDTLYYFSGDNEYIISFGKVKFSNQDGTLTSDSLYYSVLNDSLYAYGGAYLKKLQSDIKAETINLIKSDGYFGYSFKAKGGVVINDNDIQINGEEVIYIDSIQHMSILGNGYISNQNKELFGENIFIQFKDSSINEIAIDKDPIVYNKIRARLSENTIEEHFTDVMQGESMIIKYSDNKIEEIKVMGMASSLYHVIDNMLLEGTNEVSGDTILFSFINEELIRIMVQGGGAGHFTPEFNNSSIDSIIYYFAEKIDYNILKNENHFYNQSSIQYKDTKLNSEYIKINWDTNKLESHVVNNIKPIVQTDLKSSPIRGDTIYYDLISEIGIINKGKTELNNAYYHGEEILHDKKNNVYSYDGIYTSCDLDHPHYYFLSKKMKMIPDKHIIAKPIILHIKDFPIIGFPFAVLPNKGGSRQSGWIMPTFGYSERNGTYFHNLGYYHVINDYSEMKLLSNFYDRKGFKINFNFKYNIRYNYSGDLSSTLVQNLNSSSDNINNIFSNATQNYNLKWIHNYQIDPSQNFNFNINYISKNDFYQQSQMGYNADTRLQQNILSTLNYRKHWNNSNNSLSLNLSDSYNVLLEQSDPVETPTFYRTRILPKIKFIHGARLLFGDGPHWYNSIYYNYNSNFTISRQEGHTLFDDQKSDTIKYKNGINHTLSLTGSQNIFKYINFNTRINILESWIYGYKKPKIDSEGLFIDDQYTDFSNSYKRRLTGNLSFGMSTKLYGILSTNLFNISAIRHVISPSLSYSYTPDFSNSTVFGLDINYIETDLNGSIYDYFSNSLVPSTPTTRRETYSFKLNNDFYGKILNNGDFKKVHLLNWSSSLSYNPTYDEFNWSYISSSFRSTISNDLNFTINMNHDLYKISEGTRINELGDFPRFSDINSSMQFKLRGKKITGFQKHSITSKNISDSINNINSNLLDTYEPIISDENVWEATFNFGSIFKYNKDLDNWDKDFWFDSNLEFKPTKNWTVSYSARFDIMNNQIIRHSLILHRPLHCWLFSFQWYPGVGENNFGNGFQLLIKVKNPDLQDIRLKHTQGNMFGF